MRKVYENRRGCVIDASKGKYPMFTASKFDVIVTADKRGTTMSFVDTQTSVMYTVAVDGIVKEFK